jgi:hypothetical protein
MSTTFSITRDSVIVAALRKLGVVEPADTATSGTIDANILSNAVTTLNLMVKQWSTEGIKLWTTVDVPITLLANTTTYTIPSASTDKSLKLINAWLRNTSVSPYIDTPLMLLSKQEYNSLSSKVQPGVPNSVYHNPGINTSTVSVYNTPDTSTATNYLLYLTIRTHIADIASGTDAAITNFPSEWYNILVWNLADELALEFGIEGQARNEIQQRASMYKEKMIDWDVEEEATLFTPGTAIYC